MRRTLGHFSERPPYLLNISARHVIDRKTMMAQIQRIHRVVCPVAAQLVSHAQSARRISRHDDQSSDSHQRQRILAGAKRRAVAMPWPAHLYTGASHGS